MKKLTLLALAATSFTAQAQQLPNADFNGKWTDCIPYIGAGQTAKVQGTQPEGWIISNVNGYQGVGATIVGDTLVENDNLSVLLKNTPNPFMASQIVPAYMSLGTTWNTSKGMFSIKNKDGGAFGGIEFTHRPDAVRFRYKRTAASPEIPATVVAYMWKGEWQQAEVPVTIALTGEPTRETMINRDRNILNVEYAEGGSVTQSKDALCIAQIQEKLSEVTERWTDMIIPFAYADSSAVPTHLNVIFAANDYFDATTVKQDNSLAIDDVMLVYYHELDSVAYGDKVYKFAAGQNVIDLTGVKYDADTALTYFKKGVGATVKSAYNEKSGVMTVEVMGDDFATNPASKSVYYIRFAADSGTQLVNASFDEEWLNCYPYFGHDKAADKAIGTQPAGWNIANVWGMNSLGATRVGEQAEGMTEGTKAVKLTNTPNSILASQIVPGYMGLGTTWNTSVMGKENDGGSFGGIEFTNRPDAVEFYYQRICPDSTANIPATVVAYLWKGEFRQVEVPVDIALFGSPKKETMTDRDRNILGLPTDKGGEVTKSDDAELIGSVIAHLTDTTDTWTKQLVEIDYRNTEALPARMNLIFAANDYFDAATVKAGNSLIVDSVKFVYYHGIDSVQYKGNTYVPENGLIDLSAEKFDAAEVLTIVKKGVGATVETGAYNPATGLLPVTVRSEDFAVNPAGISTYQLQFYVAPEGIEGITQNAANGLVDVYSVEGKLIRSRVAAASALNGLSSGVYIINGRKVMK